MQSILNQSTPFLRVALFAFAALFLTPAAPAQEYGTSGSQKTQDVSAAHLDQAKVKAFARAHAHVNQLHQQYELRLANTTPEESATIRQEAAQAMNTAVENEGLTIDEYNSIARSMIANPTLQEQISREMESL